MKNRILLYFSTLVFSLAIAPVFAQLQIPRPSPNASVTQAVGLTDITIDYSSPGVKDRTIWGGLVPYDKVWRTGANAATAITFSRDVTIAGNKVPKGKYSVFTIPGATEFTVILNKDVTATTDSYKMEEDQLRFKVKVAAAPFRERLAFMFSNFDDTKTTIDFEWEKIRVSFDVMVDTDAQTRESITNTLDGTWRTYNSAARYFLDHNTDLETAMKLTDQSLDLKEDWFNCWTKAQLYSAMNNNAEAYKWALKAKELGDKSSSFFFKSQVEKGIADWKPAGGKTNKK
ncbi:MAG TPA: DUF2911 domain-containing protein [Bacteroidia bacterium]|nr:DUF2911 domain-containing protein [Bacteroidia bacterium]